jgi:hypothetical protein
VPCPKDLSVETELTEPPTAGPQYDRRSNRPSFSEEQKLAIVMEPEAPGVSVPAVCRRHDLSTSMVFRWRIPFGFGAEQPAKLVSVAVAGTGEDERRGCQTEVRSCCRIVSRLPTA